RQVGGRDHLAGHHDHQALDHVAQFTDVSRPPITLQPLNRASVEPLGPPPVLARKFVDEVFRQQQDVVAAVPQRRDVHGDDVNRKYKSSRNRPARISDGRSLFVAASTRTSTLTLDAPPTGSTTCSCSARSTLACVLRVMSPISSRKSVPPSASSNLPRRSADRESV